MDASDPRYGMPLYNTNTVSGPPSGHLHSATLIHEDDIYGPVEGGVQNPPSSTFVMNGCLHRGASSIRGGPGSGPAAEPDAETHVAASRSFRADCLSQQPSMSFQQAHQQQPHVHIGAASTKILGSGSPKPIRRRMRMITSCLECRRRKLRCNKSNPCTNCLRFSRDCFYLGPKLDEASQRRLTEIKEKVGSLERQLERDVAKSGGRGYYPQQRMLADDFEDDDDEEDESAITPLAALDLTCEDEADIMNDILDLGVQIGKTRLTEKTGGLSRLRTSEEVCFPFSFLCHPPHPLVPALTVPLHLLTK